MSAVADIYYKLPLLRDEGRHFQGGLKNFRASGFRPSLKHHVSQKNFTGPSKFFCSLFVILQYVYFSSNRYYSEHQFVFLSVVV